MTDPQINKDIGEIKGLLEGVVRMMDQQHRGMNQRIDDMHASNTRRLDDISQAIHNRLDGHQRELAEVKAKAEDAHRLATQHEEAIGALKRQATKSGSVAGVGAGTIVSVGIEIIRRMFMPGP